mmetsp:Transcript_50311/g.151498  ORF Transcript_50311/g.151498 Transcript_50311/m.151498 type:complete len:135 (-) Transcript_50311:1255-1659(-)
MPVEREVDRERAMETMAAEQSKQMMLLAAYGVGLTVVLKVLAMIAMPLFVVAFPLVYISALQSCPQNESFDAKNELKRVMRGQNVPEGQPSKPKGLIAKTFKNLQATVQTELATSMGYEVTLMVCVALVFFLSY